MKKTYFKNILSIAVSFIILISGGFSFAVGHNSCLSDGEIHYSCEENICGEDKCCEESESEDKISTPSITTIPKDCCEIHEENFLITEPFLISNNTNFTGNVKIQYEVEAFDLFANFSISTNNKQLYLKQFHHIYSIPDIIIQNSNLRI